MKEQWNSEKDVATLEEGLQREKQEYISKLKNNANCCKHWIRYIRLIFLLELTLFLGWGCYMILQSYHSRVTENEATDITPERYPLVFKSVSEVQKSHPTVEMPMIFVKPEITDNNFLEGIELKEPDLMPSKTIVINVDSSMQTSTQNSISMPNNNMMEASDINNSPMISSSEDLVYDKGFMKMSWKILPIENIDKIITSNNKEFNFEQFLEKLQNIAINDFKKFENNNDFTENVDRLILNNQKDRAPNTFNEIESLGLDVTTLNLGNSVDLKINLKNSAQDPEQRFLDIIEYATQDDPSEKSSSRDGTDEQINASLQSDLVICQPYQSYESSDMSSEHSIQSSSTSQSVSTPEFFKQIKNSDDDIKNKDKHDADDSNMSMSASSDISTSGSYENFDTWISIVPNTKDHHSSEISANTKQEEEMHKLMKNVEPSFGLLQSEIPGTVESSTSNVINFQWLNAPPIFANNLQTGSKDISESDKIQNPSLEDTTENTETIDAFIPEKAKFHNQCQIETKMNVLTVKCGPEISSEIMFEKEWNHAFNTHTADISEDNFDFNIDDYFDYYDKDESAQLKDELISNENSDKKIENVQHSASKLIDAIISLQLQESIPHLRTSKEASDLFFKINSFDRTKDKHDTINSPDTNKEKREIASSSTTIFSFTESDSDTVDSNKEWNPLLKVSDTQQQKQLKVTETQDSLDSENAKTSFENNERVFTLEKELTSIFNDKMLNIVKQQFLSNSFSENDYSDYICSIPPFICPQKSWRQQYVDFKKFLEKIHIQDNSYDIKDDYNYRKKRMTDDLTEQHEQVSNTLKEVNKDVNIFKENSLKKIFQEVKILAACIDRLHERLLNNKLDDDYASNEFPMKTKESYINI